MHSVSFLNVSVVPANTSGDANSYLKIMIVVISVLEIIINDKDTFIIIIINNHHLKRSPP